MDAESPFGQNKTMSNKPCESSAPWFDISAYHNMHHFYEINLRKVIITK